MLVLKPGHSGWEKMQREVYNYKTCGDTNLETLQGGPEEQRLYSTQGQIKSFRSRKPPESVAAYNAVCLPDTMHSEGYITYGAFLPLKQLAWM